MEEEEGNINLPSPSDEGFEISYEELIIFFENLLELPCGSWGEEELFIIEIVSEDGNKEKFTAFELCLKSIPSTEITRNFFAEGFKTIYEGGKIFIISPLINSNIKPVKR